MSTAHQNFETHVTDSLARLETKMDAVLVWKDDAEDRLRAAEQHRWRASGLVSAIVSAIVSGLLGHWRQG